jgi:predicted homoserine dehydrogenase-like protein
MSLDTYHQLLRRAKQDKPIEVIVVGLGFMGFGFVSNVKYSPGINVPLIISRRPHATVTFLRNSGYRAKIEHHPGKIKDLSSKDVIAVSDDLGLIDTYPNEIVMEMTGTIDYGTLVALRTVSAGKHLITMNPELQATVGSELKKLFDQKKRILTDVVGDQPGSLARLIASAKLKGFRPVMAGNMKRYLDIHATQSKMKPWADDKGLAVRQTVSFTDGTKQSIEMNLVANYFGMSLIEAGMKGPVVESFEQVLDCFDWSAVPPEGVVDYMIGRKLFPGVFIVAEHTDPHQQKYLRYLNLGDGPRYVLFDSYHLCHLEVNETIAQVALSHQPTINNSINPVTTTISLAKFDLTKGTVLDGIGGDTVYGSIRKLVSNKQFLPVGLSHGAILKQDIPQNAPILLSDVELPANAATRLLGLT